MYVRTPRTAKRCRDAGRGGPPGYRAGYYHLVIVGRSAECE